MQHAKKPLFIIFEGIDGSGKSTCARNVLESLTLSGSKAKLFFEPTAESFGKEIRNLLAGKNEPDSSRLLELFLKDRINDVNLNILPTLEKGTLVLLDRYYYSNAAYQAANAIEANIIVKKNRSLALPEPDLIFYLDIHPDAALERINARKNEKSLECFEKKERLETIAANYAAVLPDTCIKIDALQSEKKIVSQVLSIIREKQES